MNTLDIKPGERVKDVHFTEDTLSVDLIDGRTIISDAPILFEIVQTPAVFV